MKFLWKNSPICINVDSLRKSFFSILTDIGEQKEREKGGGRKDKKVKRNKKDRSNTWVQFT